MGRPLLAVTMVLHFSDPIFASLLTKLGLGKRTQSVLEHDFYIHLFPIILQDVTATIFSHTIKILCSYNSVGHVAVNADILGRMSPKYPLKIEGFFFFSSFAKHLCEEKSDSVAHPGNLRKVFS